MKRCFSQCLFVMALMTSGCVSSPPSYHTERTIIQEPRYAAPGETKPDLVLDALQLGDRFSADGKTLQVVSQYVSALGEPCFGLIDQSNQRNVACKRAQQWYLETPLLRGL